MNSSNLRKITMAVMLCAVCSTAFAQTGDVWRKRTARIIDIRQKEDNATHPNKKETTLIGMLLDAIKAGKLTAYANEENYFATKISPANLEKMIYRVDTIVVTNPINNTEETKIVKFDFDLSSIHKYRILEEWALNPYTGKTEIQITGIAPIRDIYGDDGIFRGIQAMFWVRYNDAYSTIAGYDKSHPHNAFTEQIWADYFVNDSTTGELWKRKVFHLFDLSPKEENYHHHFTDVKTDSSVYEMIANEIKSGKLFHYDDGNLSHKQSYEELKQKYTRTDTITVLDPIDNTELIKVATRDFYSYNIQNYRVLEEWLFDPPTGKTSIQITGIAPVRQTKNYEGVVVESEVMFWMRYIDVRGIIAKYEQYNPEKTIAMHIWNDYFLNDVKPEAQK